MEPNPTNQKIPYSLYEPVLARVIGREKEDEPSIGTLDLPEEVLALDGGRWAWFQGQKVCFLPFVKDGKVDLRVLELLTDPAKKEFKNEYLDLCEDRIPEIVDTLLLIITKTHPLIDFTDVSFFNTNQTDKFLGLIKQKTSYDFKVKGEVKTRPYAAHGQWGIIEEAEQEISLKKSIIKEAKEHCNRVEDARDVVLFELDPHCQIIQESTSSEISATAKSIVDNTFTIPPEIFAVAKEGDFPAFLPKFPDPVDAFNCLIQKTDPNQLWSSRSYVSAFMPTPETYSDSSAVLNTIKLHVGSLPLEVKSLRRGWLLSHGAFLDANFSLSYKDGILKKGESRQKVYRLKNLKDMVKGYLPFVLSLETPDKDLYELTNYGDGNAIMYNGPCWYMTFSLKGDSKIVLPGIYFAEEEEFIKYAIDPIPSIKDTYQRGKSLVYVMNDTWCERNFSFRGVKEGLDYHYPGVNARSVVEWIYGPMSAKFLRDGKPLNSIEVYNPVGVEQATQTFEDYQKLLQKVNQELDNSVSPELLSLIRNGIGGAK